MSSLMLILVLLLSEPADPATPAPAGSGPPDVVVLDHLENLYEPVPFDHRRHAEMAEMTTGCTACHHNTAVGTEYPACRTCHNSSQARENIGMPGLRGAYHRQCMDCHREWSHDTACGACHRPKAVWSEFTNAVRAASPGDIVGADHAPITAAPTYVYATGEEPWPVVTFHHADHVETFGLACTDCHQGDSCARCHDDAARFQERHHQRESCYACHGGKDCSFCHDQTQRPRFDHVASSGWPLEPYHADVACVECHGPPATGGAPSPDCHACHLGRPGFNHAAIGVALGQRTSQMDCLGCHTDMKKLFDDAEVIHGPASTAAGCSSCHGTLLPGSPRVPTGQQKELCLRCHNRPITTGHGRPLMNIAGLLSASPDHHGPVKDGQCCACHLPHASPNTRLLVDTYPPGFYASFDVDQYRLCFRCHESDKMLDSSGTGVTGFRDGDRNLHWLHVNRSKGRTCRACHQVHASSQPFHIRDTVPFGKEGWLIEINYRQIAGGGACGPTCHTKKVYRRGDEDEV